MSARVVAPPVPCVVPTCTEFAAIGGRCAEHARSTITRCPPGDGFGGEEPRLDPVALDRAGHWLDALYSASRAVSLVGATPLSRLTTNAVAELRHNAIDATRDALRGMLGDDHAEFRGYYDKLVARSLTPDEMRKAAGRLFTVADMARHIEAESAAEHAEDDARDTEPAPPMHEHPEPPELLAGG